MAAPARYLVLSAELPAEGVWCDAASYVQLVRCVTRVWGSDFACIFKYKLACDAQGVAEEGRLQRTYASIEAGAVAFAQNGNKSRATVRLLGGNARAHGDACMRSDDDSDCGTCDVVIDDENDFALWYYGGAALTLCPHGTSGAGDTNVDDDIHHAMYHAGDHAAMTPLTQTLYVYRKTTQLDETAARHMTSNRDERVGSYHSYYHVSTNRDGVWRYRSSPAVRSSSGTGGSNVVFDTPLHALLPAQLILRLQVSVVLRHSNATEVMLLSRRNYAHSTANTAWGALMTKAKSAWGVHMPVFAYTDMTRGVTRMYITNAAQYAMWSRTVADSGRHELVVLEHAIDAHVCADRLVARQVMRYRQTHPTLARTQHSSLCALSAQLRALQMTVDQQPLQRQRLHAYDDDATQTGMRSACHTGNDEGDDVSSSSSDSSNSSGKRVNTSNTGVLHLLLAEQDSSLTCNTKQDTAQTDATTTRRQCQAQLLQHQHVQHSTVRARYATTTSPHDNDTAYSRPNTNEATENASKQQAVCFANKKQTSAPSQQKRDAHPPHTTSSTISINDNAYAVHSTKPGTQKTTKRQADNKTQKQTFLVDGTTETRRLYNRQQRDLQLSATANYAKLVCYMEKQRAINSVT